MFGMPILIFWIMVYPMTCLLYMVHNKKRIESVEIRTKMGYYVNGYKPNFFYW